MQIETTPATAMYSPIVSEMLSGYKAVNLRTEYPEFQDFLRASISYGLTHPAHRQTHLKPFNSPQQIMDAHRRATSYRNNNESEVRDVPSPQPHSHGLPTLQSCYDHDYYTMINPWTVQEASDLNSGTSMFQAAAPSAPGLFGSSPGFDPARLEGSIPNVTSQDTVAPFQVLHTGRNDMDLRYPIYYGNLDVSSFKTINIDVMDNAQLTYEPTSPASSTFPISESSATISSGDSDDFFGHSFNSTLPSSAVSSAIFKVESDSPSPVPGLSDGFAMSWHSTTDMSSVASKESMAGNTEINHPPTRRRVRRLRRRIAKTSNYEEDPDYEEADEDNRGSTAPTSAISRNLSALNYRNHEEAEADDAVDAELPNHRLKNETESAYRRRRDQLLLDMRELGISYREIKRRGAFDEAESTLRGRWRMLSKDKAERVRQPIWTPKDEELLPAAVREHSKGRLGRNGKLPWKQISLWISEHGGSYCFAPATCSKKWEELKKRN